MNFKDNKIEICEEPFFIHKAVKNKYGEFCIALDELTYPIINPFTKETEKYETMIFPITETGDVRFDKEKLTERYATKKEALERFKLIDKCLKNNYKFREILPQAYSIIVTKTKSNENKDIYVTILKDYNDEPTCKITFTPEELENHTQTINPEIYIMSETSHKWVKKDNDVIDTTVWVKNMYDTAYEKYLETQKEKETKQYCYSLNGQIFSYPYNNLQELKKDLNKELAENNLSEYWIGESVSNEIKDYINSEEILSDIWENMEWDDKYPDENAINSMTKEDWNNLNKEFAQIIEKYKKKTGKLNFGCHIENIKKYTK